VSDPRLVATFGFAQLPQSGHTRHAHLDRLLVGYTGDATATPELSGISVTVRDRAVDSAAVRVLTCDQVAAWLPAKVQSLTGHGR
jgi:hypothetical protein